MSTQAQIVGAKENELVQVILSEVPALTVVEEIDSAKRSTIPVAKAIADDRSLGWARVGYFHPADEVQARTLVLQTDDASKTLATIRDVAGVTFARVLPPAPPKPRGANIEAFLGRPQNG